jgi:hypothetical protein
MFCKTLNATMSTDACIRRQEWAKHYKKNLSKSPEKSYDHSLVHCFNCTNGIKIKGNPEKFINRDYYSLVNRHIKNVNERGWVVKEPIAYPTLFDNYTYNKMALTLERKKASEKNKGRFRLSHCQQGRINGLVDKSRNLAGSKPDIFQSHWFRSNTDRRIKSKNDDD